MMCPQVFRLDPKGLQAVFSKRLSRTNQGAASTALLAAI
jgi:hypothetical protein